MILPPEEPPAGPWRVRSLSDVARFLIDQAGDVLGRPVVIAIDGRSASGKSTVAARLQQLIGAAVVVHSDDIAWYQSFFDWSELMEDGVLGPVHRGEEVAFRPPAWYERCRSGAVTVPADCAVLLVEGVGVARRSLMKFYDAVVWVQSDMGERRTRGLARDGDSQAEVAFWDEWEAAEVPFLADEKPWQRADLIVAGTVVGTVARAAHGYDTHTQLVVAIGLQPAPAASAHEHTAPLTPASRPPAGASRSAAAASGSTGSREAQG